MTSASGDIEHDAALAEGPGKRLREAREAKGLSLRAMADELHLPTETVAALEADDFDALPVPTFVRGYIRNYARAVGLPEESLIDDYVRASGAGEIDDIALPRQRYGASGQDDTWLRRTTYVVLLLVVVLAALWWHNRGAWPPWAQDVQEPAESPPAAAETSAGTGPAAPRAASVPEADTLPGEEAQPDAGPPDAVPPAPAATADAEVAHPAPETATRQQAAAPEPSAERSTPLPGPPTEVAPMAEAPLAELDVAGEQATSGEEGPEASPAGGPPPTQPARAQTAPSATTAPSAAGGDEPVTPAPGAEAPASGSAGAPAGAATELVLHFNEPSWVELTDAVGERLMFDLGRPGQTQRLEGRPPFEVLLGNAPAVEIEVGGEPYDHGRHIGSNNVARFTIEPAGEE